MAGDFQPSSSEENLPISAINVTPFVDVALVLLVIFMITAPALMKDSLGLNLPKTQTGGAQTITPLGVAITKQGQILIHGQLADPVTLTAVVKEALAKNPEAQALISADQDARHGDVVRAIDLIKSAGLTRFAIQIEHP